MNGSRSSNGEWNDERELKKRPELILFWSILCYFNGLFGIERIGEIKENKG